LIAEHVGLVESVVGRIMVSLPDSVDREDLISCGIVGLISAVARYQPERGVKFDTYATTVVWGHVMDELRRQDWAPRSVREKCRRLERTMADLEARLGRVPEEQEMAEALSLSVDEYHRMLSAASAVALTSLEDILAGGDVAAPRETVPENPDTLDDPEAIAQRGELHRLLARAIDTLPERERLLIALYYHEELTLREIGTILGVTESRVCQIHTQAVLRLRARLRRELGAD
jgi:RNA polymerase sigma factor for flagellar operon FliA